MSIKTENINKPLILYLPYEIRTAKTNIKYLSNSLLVHKGDEK